MSTIHPIYTAIPQGVYEVSLAKEKTAKTSHTPPLGDALNN